MTDSVKPAICNWLWLAELPEMRDALVVGEYPQHLELGLEKQFGSVQVQAMTPGAPASLPFGPHSFDCVLFDQSLGEALASATMQGGKTLLVEARRVVRSGGCILVPIAQLRRRRPATLEKPLRQAGFAEIRSVYVYESLDRPNTMVPVGRRTATFFESWGWGGVRGKLRAGLAFAGAHHLTQPSLLMLAYP